MTWLDDHDGWSRNGDNDDDDDDDCDGWERSDDSDDDDHHEDEVVHDDPRIYSRLPSEGLGDQLLPCL